MPGLEIEMDAKGVARWKIDGALGGLSQAQASAMGKWGTQAWGCKRSNLKGLNAWLGARGRALELGLFVVQTAVLNAAFPSLGWVGVLVGAAASHALLCKPLAEAGAQVAKLRGSIPGSSPKRFAALCRIAARKFLLAHWAPGFTAVGILLAAIWLEKSGAASVWSRVGRWSKSFASDVSSWKTGLAISCSKELDRAGSNAHRNEWVYEELSKIFMRGLDFELMFGGQAKIEAARPKIGPGNAARLADSIGKVSRRDSAWLGEHFGIDPELADCLSSWRQAPGVVWSLKSFEATIGEALASDAWWRPSQNAPSLAMLVGALNAMQKELENGFFCVGDSEEFESKLDSAAKKLSVEDESYELRAVAGVAVSASGIERKGLRL